jgi:hypothetical protein
LLSFALGNDPDRLAVPIWRGRLGIYGQGQLGTRAIRERSFVETRECWGSAMSAWFNNAPPLLLDESVKIAMDFLERTGEIDDFGEACQFLVNKIGFMIAQGQRNRLLLANRAIAAYQRYRKSRTLELSLVS